MVKIHKGKYPEGKWNDSDDSQFNIVKLYSADFFLIEKNDIEIFSLQILSLHHTNEILTRGFQHGRNEMKRFTAFAFLFLGQKYIFFAYQRIPNLSKKRKKFIIEFS